MKNLCFFTELFLKFYRLIIEIDQGICYNETACQPERDKGCAKGFVLWRVFLFAAAGHSYRFFLIIYYKLVRIELH